MLKLLLIIVAAYLGFVLLVFLTQDRMLYLPDLMGRALTATPSTAGMPFDDVWISTADGVRLHGWLIHGSSDKTVLFFHGNAGNISHRLTSIEQFWSLGYSVFILDYRGYGQSEGKPTEAGTYRDADAAWRYLTSERGVAADNIVVFGRSLGGAVSAHLVSRLNAAEMPSLLIVESAFSSVNDAARDHYPFLPVRWISRFGYATEEYIRQVQCPVLVIHSRNDEIISFRHGESIFAAAPEPKELLIITGGHNDGFLSSDYLEGLNRRLRL